LNTNYLSQLYEPLGRFAISFVKLEREISWSFVSASALEVNETENFLSEIWCFEAKTKRFSDRVSIWRRTLAEAETRGDARTQLDCLKKQIVVLLGHRNRLLHDTSGKVQISYPEYVVQYCFTKPLKNGTSKETQYSVDDINNLSDEIEMAKSDIRAITYSLYPLAPKMVV